MKNLSICILLSLCLFSCGEKPKPAEKAVEVKVYVVEPKTIPVDFELVGVVRSSHSVEIRSRVEGYLQKINYQEGSFVNEGDVLFEIDPRQFEDAVKEANANLEKEQAALWQAQQAVNRYKPLFEQKAASRKDLDDATAQFLSAQATVNLFLAKLDEAKLNLGYATITSPISGFTSNAKFQEGSLITPSATGELTTVSVIDPIWVVVNVSDYYFLISNEEIEKKTLIIPENYAFDVVLTLADGTIYPFHGKVSFISPLFDQSTGTLSARAVFPNPDHILKPGQFVKARGIGAKRPDAIIVPQEAVQQSMAGLFVYVVNDKNRVETRYVHTGDWYQKYWVIKSGLQKGDQVIVAGVNKVKEQTLVKVKE